MLQALAHHAVGDLPAAMMALSWALDEAPEPDSYVRLYLDEGASMLALLSDAANLTGASPMASAGTRIRRLLERAHGVEYAAPPHSGSAPLSRRELEVLRLLASELTGPEIARHLFVSVNTLRTHTKRIFTKLGVRSRAAAVHRARERGLL